MRCRRSLKNESNTHKQNFSNNTAFFNSDGLLYRNSMITPENHLVLPQAYLDYLKRYCGRLPVKVITARLGIDVPKYCRLKKRLGLSGRYKSEQKRQIVRKHYKDMTFTEMARTFGGTNSSYARYAKELGLKQPQEIIDKINRLRVESRGDWKRKHNKE